MVLAILPSTMKEDHYETRGTEIRIRNGKIKTKENPVQYQLLDSMWISAFATRVQNRHYLSLVTINDVTFTFAVYALAVS